MAGPLPSNREVAERLSLLGDLLELEGADRHRVLAYRRGAARVRATAASVAELARAGRAVELPDIGTTLQAKIVELADTGTIAALEAVRERVPEGLAEVARLGGIGPKRAIALWTQLGIDGLDALADALASGRLRDVTGFGERSEESLREQLAARAAGAPPERVSIGIALPLARELLAAIASAPGVVRVEIAGSLRRGVEDVHDIDLVAATRDPAAARAALAGHPAVASTLTEGEATVAVLTHNGIRAELATAPPERFGNLLQHATGSAAHNVRLRERALRSGLSLSQHGIVDRTGALAEHRHEDEVYGALGLAPIPPELREDLGEIEDATRGPLPRLVERVDLRGDLHVHSAWSDGTASIAEMVDAARARGLSYLAISDHSPSLAMARGLSPERLRRQWDEIATVDARHDDISVLRATEVDILADGTLDLPDDVLAQLDWVTASLHSGFAAGAERLTARVLAAIESPHVDAIGHPTGRMRGRRAAAEMDMGSIYAAAARTRTFLEVNGQPRRLDLDARMAREALAAGACLVIGSDAHAAAALDLIEYGLLVARRAGARPEDVGNTRPWPELAGRGAGCRS